MPKLKLKKPYYENRAKREIICMFAPNKSFNAYRMWCKRNGIKKPYSSTTIRKYANIPKNLIRFTTRRSRLALIDVMRANRELKIAIGESKIAESKSSLVEPNPLPEQK